MFAIALVTDKEVRWLETETAHKLADLYIGMSEKERQTLYAQIAILAQDANREMLQAKASLDSVSWLMEQMKKIDEIAKGSKQGGD